MYVQIIILPLMSFSLYFSNLYTNLTLANKLDSLDKILLKIEGNLKSGNYKQVCIDSKKGLYIIKSNIENFKSLEKYYHWEEMEQLLANLHTDKCN